MKLVSLKFDENKPVLEQSKYAKPSFGWVNALRKKFPQVWDSADSKVADDSFAMWKSYEEGHRSESINKWLVKREQWAAKNKSNGFTISHKTSSPILLKQVLNMLKWGVVGEIGLDKMIEVVSHAIEGKTQASSIGFVKTFSNYPDEAVANAKKGLVWKENHADRKVDRIWEISEKFINGDKLTIDELKLIADFEKHKSHRNDPINTSQENTLYNAIGGTHGIIWAKRTLESLGATKSKLDKSYKIQEKKCASVCVNCFSYKEGFCEQQKSLVMPTYSCDDWAEYKHISSQNVFSDEKKNLVDKSEKHILNVEETSSSYIVEFEKPESTEEEDFSEGEKIAVPGYISSNAKKGLSLLEYAGGGLTSKTKAEARQLAAGNASENKIVRMNAWFQRHVSDLSSDAANDYLNGSSDRPTAGQVAWLLWGGDLGSSNRLRAQKWAESKVNSFEEGEASYHKDDEEKRVSFRHDGKTFYGIKENDGVEIVYKSEEGKYFKTGTKYNLEESSLADAEFETEGKALRWTSQAPITDTKAFKEIKDQNGAIVDYKDVTFKGYASTNEDVTKGDRIGDYLKKGAFKKTISKFMQNPVMLLDHQNSVKEIAGTYTSLKEDRNGLLVEGKISNSPDLRNIRFLVAEGHLKTLSIGGLFLYGEDGKAIEEVNLFEISLVAIPMNPDAIVSVRNIDEEFFFEKR